MVAHCFASYPNEACGILAGKNMIVSEIFIMTNTEKSPVRYLMDPEEQFKMMRKLRHKSLQMIAIFHSHPDSAAYPSATDRDMAYYEDAVYVIVSLAEREPDVRGFSFRNEELYEVEISVIFES